MNKLQWRTELEIVDIETGEIISKSRYEREEYYKVKTENKNKIIEYISNGYVKKIGIRCCLWQCRKRNQTKLF